ncbi:MAG TPA: vWA domain-containing protein [Polyangia bacterium]|nr:vWA domain-containing protein [Polyangia bacterium]
MALRSSCFRALVSIAALAPVLLGCIARTVERPELAPDITNSSSGPIVANRNVDLLFLIDDSMSMTKSQENLLRNFPVLMNALQNLAGGLPNVHVAVASSDMGAGDGSIGLCNATGGKNGAFQHTARGACTATGLDPGATFIANVDGQKNYAGDLGDVFSCIAALGDGGCGFEQPLAAISRALGADGPAPAENEGFLRPDAFLAIVLISNEDDCSVPGGSLLFDRSANQTLDSALGPPISFRCNEFGHLCDGAPPARLAPNGDMNATRSYASCVPSDGAGLLSNVVDTAARIKALKADPEQVMVAAITGLPAPYAVHWTAPGVRSDPPWPEVSHSCIAGDGSFADPAIRTSAFVNEFGANGLLLPICADDFAPALSRIAEKIADHVSKPCVAGTVAKRPGTASDDCVVVSMTADGQGGRAENVLSSCADTAGVGPCWQLGAGENGCAGQSLTVVPDATAPAPAWQSVTLQCALCVSGVSDPTRGCP